MSEIKVQSNINHLVTHDIFDKGYHRYHRIEHGVHVSTLQRYAEANHLPKQQMII